MVFPNERKINPLRISVHGIAVALQSDNHEWLARLARDFSFFADNADPSPDVELTVLFRDPDWSRLPDRPASQVFSECVTYENRNERFIDYHGQALLQESGNSALLEATDPDLAHELAFLFILSKVGTRLDAKGLHRVHAFGFVKNGTAALVLIPSGGGKSTLARALLEQAEEDGITLLSDDTPLVDRAGRALPFPLRLAYRKEFPLPEEWNEQAEILKRRKYGEKKLVPLSALPAAAQPTQNARYPVSAVILAERHGSRREPRLVRTSRRKILAALTRDMVVGLGLPQVAELILRKGFVPLAKLAPTAASRLFAANRLALSAKGYRLQMSDDSRANAKAILEAFS